VKPAKRVFLTGAGFTKNFGGYLGAEMWSVIFSQKEIGRRTELRNHLLKTLDYEDAYNSVLYSDQLSNTEKEEFTEAVKKAYQQLHQAICAPSEVKKKHQAHAFCKAFVSRFAGEGDQRGFIFTLNQDLFLEQFYLQSYSHDCPRIPGLGHSNWFQGRLGETLQAADWIVLPSQEKVDKLAAGFWNSRGEHFMYVKLHGSYGWRTSGNSDVMVIGSEKKGLIEGEPILRWFFSLFEQVLYQGGCDLVVIGYGFRDAHINKLINTAIEKYGLRLHVISQQLPSDFRNLLAPVHLMLPGRNPFTPEGDTLWQGLHGYYCNSIFDFVRDDTQTLTPLGEAFFDRLRVN